ncbi:ankyrin repeat protein [Apiospora hydei]|uniref:Ankyrin repeat protein n=1 Tax=Apiospora hydei TaxID=1337664 RepID=A0ABR1UUB1_9PEZI
MTPEDSKRSKFRGFWRSLKGSHSETPPQAVNQSAPAPVGKLPKDSLVASPSSAEATTEVTAGDLGSPRSLISSDTAVSLWTDAYDNIADQELVSAYEIVLTEQAGVKYAAQGIANAFTGSSGQGRMRIMASVAGEMTEKASSELAEGVATTAESIAKVASGLGKLLASYPPAAMALSGVAAALPILAKPLNVRKSMVSVLKHVMERIEWYMSLSNALLQENWRDNDDFARWRASLRTSLVDLYKALLTLEMRCICRYYGSGSLKAHLKEMLSLVDWDADLASLKAREGDVETQISQYNTQAVVEHLRSLRDQGAESAVSLRDAAGALDSLAQLSSDWREEQAQRHREKARKELSALIGKFYTHYKECMKRNNERVEGTCEWFTGHKTFLHWLEPGSDPVLVVSADPGCGKSTLARYLVEHTLRQELPGSAICYYFFKDSEEQRYTFRAITALLHQLFDQQPERAEACQNQIYKLGNKLDPGPEDLWDIFRHALHTDTSPVEGMYGDVVCVLDALDECNPADLKPLLKNINTLVSTGHSRPNVARVRFLLTTRGHPAIMEQINAMGSRVLRLAGEGKAEIDSIQEEIMIVANHRLGELVKRKRLDDETKGVIARSLEEKGSEQRTYLWVTLIFKALESNFDDRPAAWEKLIHDLPQGVSEAYESLLRQVKDEEFVRLLISLVVVAKQPLSLRQMTREFLQESSPSGASLGSHWARNVTEQSGHKAMAESCVAYLSIESVRKIFADDDHYRNEVERQSSSLNSSYEFLQYVGPQWAQHFCLSQVITDGQWTGDIDERYHHAYLSLFRLPQTLKQTWARSALNSTPYNRDLQFPDTLPLRDLGPYLAATFGHIRPLVEFYARGQKFPYICAPGQEVSGTPEAVPRRGTLADIAGCLLGYAVAGSSETTASYLRHTFPHTKHECVNYLWLACLDGNLNLPLIKALLGGTEAVNRAPEGPMSSWKNEQYPTLLLTAAGSSSYQSQQLLLVKLLVDNGADVLARNDSEQTVMHIVANMKSSSTGQLLTVFMEHGADIDTQDDRGRTPLSSMLIEADYSSEMTSYDSLRLLLSFGADPALPDFNEYRPLHYTAYQGPAPPVDALLGVGVHAEPKTVLGHTPLHLSCMTIRRVETLQAVRALHPSKQQQQQQRGAARGGTAMVAPSRRRRGLPGRPPQARRRRRAAGRRGDDGRRPGPRRLHTAPLRGPGGRPGPGRAADPAARRRPRRRQRQRPDDSAPRLFRVRARAPLAQVRRPRVRRGPEAGIIGLLVDGCGVDAAVEDREGRTAMEYALQHPGDKIHVFLRECMDKRPAYSASGDGNAAAEDVASSASERPASSSITYLPNCPSATKKKRSAESRMWQLVASTFPLFWLVTLARHIDRPTLLLITQRALHTYLLAVGLLLGAALAAGARSVPYRYVHGRKAALNAGTSDTSDTYVFTDERAVAAVLMGWVCWYGGLVRSYQHSYDLLGRITFRHRRGGRDGGGGRTIHLRQRERDARLVLGLAVAVLAIALGHPGFRALAGAGSRQLGLTDGAVGRFGAWALQRLFAARRRTGKVEAAWRPRSRWDQVASGVRRQWWWLKFMALRRR